MIHPGSSIIVQGEPSSLQMLYSTSSLCFKSLDGILQEPQAPF